MASGVRLGASSGSSPSEGCYAPPMLTLLVLACQVSGVADTPPPADALSEQEVAAPTPESQANAMPPLSSAEPFLAWLSTQESTLILPFEIERDPLGVQSVALMSDPAVSFSLDTGAMGITLETRLQDPCPGAETCKVWLKGKYGPLLAGELSPSGHSFTVYEVLEAVDGTPTQARRE